MELLNLAQEPPHVCSGRCKWHFTEEGCRKGDKCSVCHDERHRSEPCVSGARRRHR